MQQTILNTLLPKLGVIFLPLDVAVKDVNEVACEDESTIASNFLGGLSYILGRLQE